MKGYIVIARRMLENVWIMKNENALKLWIWLICEANFKDNGHIKRGQLFTSYDDMAQVLKKRKYRKDIILSRRQLTRIIKKMEKEDMITAERQKRGLLITVKKYDVYQFPIKKSNAEEMAGKKVCPSKIKKVCPSKTEKNASNNRDIEKAECKKGTSEVCPSKTEKNASNNRDIEKAECKKGTSEMHGVLPVWESLPILGNKRSSTRLPRARAREEISAVSHNRKKDDANKKTEIKNTKNKNQETIKTIVSFFCEICFDLPKPEITPVIEKQIKKLMASWNPCNSKNWWVNYFKRIQASDWLTGRVSNFKADLFWLIDENNMSKILSGRYDNRENKKQIVKNQPLTLAQLQMINREKRARLYIDLKNERERTDGRNDH